MVPLEPGTAPAPRPAVGRRSATRSAAGGCSAAAQLRAGLHAAAPQPRNPPRRARQRVRTPTLPYDRTCLSARQRLAAATGRKSAVRTPPHNVASQTACGAARRNRPQGRLPRSGTKPGNPLRRTRQRQRVRTPMLPYDRTCLSARQRLAAATGRKSAVRTPPHNGASQTACDAAYRGQPHAGCRAAAPQASQPAAADAPTPKGPHPDDALRIALACQRGSDSRRRQAENPQSERRPTMARPANRLRRGASEPAPTPAAAQRHHKPRNPLRRTRQRQRVRTPTLPYDRTCLSARQRLAAATGRKSAVRTLPHNGASRKPPAARRVGTGSKAGCRAAAQGPGSSATRRGGAPEWRRRRRGAAEPVRQLPAQWLPGAYRKPRRWLRPGQWYGRPPAAF